MPERKTAEAGNIRQAPSTLQNVLIQTYVGASVFPRPVKVKNLFGAGRHPVKMGENHAGLSYNAVDSPDKGYPTFNHRAWGRYNGG